MVISEDICDKSIGMLHSPFKDLQGMRCVRGIRQETPAKAVKVSVGTGNPLRNKVDVKDFGDILKVL